MKRLKAILMLVVAMMLMSPATMKAQNKREFRGAWIQCVNGQYLGKSTQQIQAMLTRQLDELQKDGVNAIIFQVRAECDALYKSLGASFLRECRERLLLLIGIRCSG